MDHPASPPTHLHASVLAVASKGCRWNGMKPRSHVVITRDRGSGWPRHVFVAQSLLLERAAVGTRTTYLKQTAAWRLCDVRR